MVDNKHYVAVGEEAVRGTAESTTVGFIPLLEPLFPTYEPEDMTREEYRGEEAALGRTAQRRMSEKWSGSLVMPLFTEAGTVAGMMGTLLKHFFGKVTSAQNAATAQYLHMLYPTATPFAAGNLDNDALTLNVNLPEGGTMINWPHVGGRVKSLQFDVEPGQPVKVTVEMFGTQRDTRAAEIGSPAYPAENLRLDYNTFTFYTGTITRTGSAPDYTDFAFGSADTIKPDKVTLKLENGMEDMIRLAGVQYADKTRLNGIFKASLEFTMDWEDPASGFSSADDVAAWVAAASETNFFLHFDTGTVAGTGDNHQVYIDLPNMMRRGGDPELTLESDPMVTLKYESLYTSTTAYPFGAMIKNTATVL